MIERANAAFKGRAIMMRAEHLDAQMFALSQHSDDFFTIQIDSLAQPIVDWPRFQ